MKPSSGHTYILWSLCWFLTVLKFLSAVYYLMNANFCFDFHLLVHAIVLLPLQLTLFRREMQMLQRTPSILKKYIYRERFMCRFFNLSES